VNDDLLNVSGIKFLVTHYRGHPVGHVDLHIPAHIEEVVIHELLHIKLYGLDQMIEHLIDVLYGDDEDARKELNWSFFMEMLESTTEDLTKGYLQASGKRNPLDFSRVDRQVQEELGE